MASCNLSYDNKFGPVVDGCRSTFDFSLLFEQSILSIGPAALLLLFTPYKLLRLSKASRKLLPARGIRTGLLKYVSISKSAPLRTLTSGSQGLRCSLTRSSNCACGAVDISSGHQCSDPRCCALFSRRRCGILAFCCRT